MAELDPLIRKYYENKPGFPEYNTLPAEGPGSTVVEDDSPLINRQREIIEHYQALDGTAFQRSDFLPSVREPRSGGVDLANILIGGEMSALGMKLDEEGLHASWDQFKQNWSEHPIANTITSAAWVLPGVATAFNKIPRLAKFSNIPDQALVEYGFANSVEDVAQMSYRDKRMMQRHIYQMQRGRELDDLVAQGPPGEGAPLTEKLNYRKNQLEWVFRKNFANTAADHLNPSTMTEEGGQFVRRMQSYVEGDEFNRHLTKMPDPERGPAIARAIHDPTDIADLSPDEATWAAGLREDLVKHQNLALEEGFIDEATHKKVGDVWLPMQREGTPLTAGGPTTEAYRLVGRTKEGVKQFTVPRTATPHLLERQTSRAELKSILREQEAATHLKEGRRNKALSVLKGDEFTEARGLIEKGETDQALTLLTKRKPVIATPEAFTVGGLLQQKMLLESFRYVRDVALNPTFVRNTDQVKAMSKQAQKHWMDLNSLPNSGTVRRMVGKRLGKPGAVDELGWVRKDLFDNLEDIVGESEKRSHGLVTLIDTAVAMMKTAKTAGNPYTQGQNLIGDWMMLWQAGWNAMEPENFKVLKSAFYAYKDWKKAEKAGQVVSDLNLGKLTTTTTGESLDIAKEISNPVVKGLILESNLLSAEGLETLDRLFAKTDDAQVLVRGLIKGTQKVSKITGLAKAAEWYMGVDDISKLAYYLGLRKKGFTPAGAALEVSRRLPMYSHVGRAWKQSRRFVFPWISFPVEVMRVMKNNLMDNPLRTMMTFHAYKGLQSMFYPFSDLSAEGIEEQKRNLPWYAQRPGRTVMTPFKDANDDLRSMALDWLPHTALLPQTDAPEAPLLQKIPMGLGEPMSIYNSLYYALTGKDFNGNDIPFDPMNPIQDRAKTMLLSMVGFVAPPLIEKYLVNPKTPYPWYKVGQDAGTNVDPSTGKPGDPLFDLFINNLNSFGKMYPASGEQGLANRALKDEAIDKYQARLTREWTTYIKNGNLEASNGVLEDIQRLMVEKYKDPAKATQKFTEWLLRHQKTISYHPRLRGYSREQLIQLLIDSGAEAGKARTKAQADRISAIKREISIRGHKATSSRRRGAEIGEIGEAGDIGEIGGL